MIHAHLRRQAEKRLKEQGPPDVAHLPSDDVRALVHELEVHQVELEMQNEELRQAQVELADSRDRYLELYEFAPVGYFTLDPHRTIQEANLTICRLLGVERERLIGRRIDELAAPEHRDDCFRHFRSALTSGTEQSFELKFRRDDDHDFWGLVKCVPCGPGARGAGGCRASISDITATKRAEQEARDYLLQLQTVLKSMTAGVVISDVQGNLVGFNDAALKIHRFRTVDEWRRNLADFPALFEISDVDGRLLPVGRWPLSRVLDGETIADVEVDVRRNDVGLLGIWRFGGVPIQDASGNVLLAVLTVEDITERKEAQQALEELSRELERRVDERTAELRILAARLAEAQEEERRRVAAGLHDSVCQLLAACQLQVGQAENCPEAGKRQKLLEAANRILNDASDEVRKLVFELSNPALFDGGFVVAARELCDQVSRRNGVRIAFHCADDELDIPERLRADLYENLRELLANVVRHAGAEDATVRIETTPAPSLDSLPEGRRLLRVVVHDEGKGFDTDNLGWKVTPTGGYGLPHVRERMKDLGGRFHLQSAPGRGVDAVMEVVIDP